jgi:hypothetical protein
MEEHIIDASQIPWMTFAREEGRGLSVRVLLGDIPDGPEAVHSIHPEGRVFPHFHQAAQFQLVLSGSVDFPKRHLDAIAVHYTDHQVSYGPFVIGPEYQMMVVHAKPAGQVDMRDKEARGGRNRAGREIMASATEVEWEADPGRPGVRRKVLIGEPSGLRAEVIEIAPGASLAPDPAPYGQFHILAEGAAKLGGQAITRHGLRFVRGDEAPGPVVAGPEGATLVLLAFDQDAAETYGGSIRDRLAELEARSQPTTAG